MSNESKVKRTERGWAGHYVLAHYCRFRRNTLLELGKIRVVVSTVGLKDTSGSGQFEKIGLNRFFETMAFHASLQGRFWDANVNRQVHFDCPCIIDKVDADDLANGMHEKVVEEIALKMASGELKLI